MNLKMFLKKCKNVRKYLGVQSHYFGKGTLVPYNRSTIKHHITVSCHRMLCHKVEKLVSNTGLVTIELIKVKIVEIIKIFFNLFNYLFLSNYKI